MLYADSAPETVPPKKTPFYFTPFIFSVVSLFSSLRTLSFMASFFTKNPFKIVDGVFYVLNPSNIYATFPSPPFVDFPRFFFVLVPVPGKTPPVLLKSLRLSSMSPQLHFLRE